jgi:WD40 repeat protein
MRRHALLLTSLLLLSAVRPLAAQELIERVTGKHPFPVSRMALSPDVKVLASAGGGTRDRGELKLWDVATGRELASLAGHPTTGALVFSPDGKRLASSGNGRVQVWDVPARKLVATLNARGTGPRGPAPTAAGGGPGPRAGGRAPPCPSRWKCSCACSRGNSS